jgi:RES domain-containing protein
MTPVRATRLRAVAEALSNIKEVALTEGYGERLVKLLAEFREGYATTTISLSLKAAFRARKIKDDYPLTNLEQLWHPKPEQLKTFGRANLPKSPILYCSNGINTAIKEVGGKPGDRVAIMEMGLANEATKPHVFSLGELRARKRTKKGVMGAELDKILVTMRAMNIDMPFAMLVDGFYADAFKSPGEELYPLTAAIAQAYMISDRIDGITYPTVATPLGQNLALKPASAARLLAVRSVRILRIIKSFKDTFLVQDEMISRLLHTDGRIEWQR